MANKRRTTETCTCAAGFRLKGLALRVAGNWDAKIILSGKRAPVSAAEVRMASTPERSAPVRIVEKRAIRTDSGGFQVFGDPHIFRPKLTVLRLPPVPSYLSK